ncbi:MAG: hypothetical protein NT076_01495 [Candidatus Pacearchaeota archaeon]|nr:hypothetical protein [Candidatus Pacearchaeota archaeon]
MKIQTKIITSLILAIMLTSMASALIVKNVNIGKLTPGEDASLSIGVENDQSYNIKDVSFSLDFSNLPLSSSNSQDSVTQIDEDDSESFVFTIKASSTAKLGSYNIPYTIVYKNQTLPQKGTISVDVSGDVQLEFSALAETNVVGSSGKVSLKIVNKGLADARFVAVKIVPSGFTLLGSDENYIGTVSSDDFETSSFDVIFNSQSAVLNANVEYRDFDNNLQTKDITLPLTVYTQEKALELGIIKKSNTATYVIVIITLIVLYLIYRAIRKRMRRKKAEAGRN